MPVDPPYAAPRGTAVPAQSAYPDAAGWRPRNAVIHGVSAENVPAAPILQRGKKASAGFGQAGLCFAAAARKQTANQNGCRCLRVSG